MLVSQTSGAVAKSRLFSQASNLIKERKEGRLKAIKYYNVLKKIFNGALIPITPISSHLTSLYCFKQNFLVKKLAKGRII